MIWDPNPDFLPIRIPDPGVKKAPDPGSGSATLLPKLTTPPPPHKLSHPLCVCSPHGARDGKVEGGGDGGGAASLGVPGVRVLAPRQVARVAPRGAEAHGAARALRPLLCHVHAAGQAQGACEGQARVASSCIILFICGINALYTTYTCTAVLGIREILVRIRIRTSDLISIIF
jgi:hypothetical protein